MKIMILGLVVLIAGCASSNTCKEDNYFVFQKSKYRIKGAHVAYIGSLGLARHNSVVSGFNLKNRLKLTSIKVDRTAEFSKEEVHESDSVSGGKAGARKIVNGEGESAESSKVIRKGNYEIYTIVDIFGLIRELNSDENAALRAKLYNNPKSRIVTSMVITNDHQQSKKTIDADEGILKIIFDKKLGLVLTTRKVDRSEIVTNVASGTIEAYEYARFCWGKVDNGNRIIKDIMVDQPCVRDRGDCPPGSFDGTSAESSGQTI